MNFFHQHDMTNQFPEGMTFFMNHPVYIYIYEFENFPILIKWRKMNFKNCARAQFSKLRNRINGFGEFQYNTIYSRNFISIR